MVKVTYSYHCSACQDTFEEEHSVRLGGDIPKPCLPHGWNRVNNSIYCPKHNIMVQLKTYGKMRNEGIDGDV